MLSLARNELLDVNWETRASISTVVVKLRDIHRRCLDDPAYTVALPRPRKPPWPHPTFKTQTPAFKIRVIRISAKTAQQRSSKEQKSMTMSILNTHYTEPNFDWMGEFNPDYLNTEVREATSINIAPDTFESHHIVQGTNPSIPSKAPDPPLVARNPTNRRRNRDEMSNLNDIEPKRKKGRKTQEMSPRSNGRSTTRSIELKRRQNKVSGSPKADEGILFPCPFYHNNPSNPKYRTKSWQCCAGPGWTIPRLKLAPILCPPNVILRFA